MTSLKPQVVDMLGKVILTQSLRAHLGWSINTTLFASLDSQGSKVTLTKYNSQDTEAGDTLVIDDLGRICLPFDIRDELDWNERDILNLWPNIRSKTLTLTLAQKYEPVCVLCSRTESVVTINRNDICGHCVSIIVRSAS